MNSMSRCSIFHSSKYFLHELADSRIGEQGLTHWVSGLPSPSLFLYSAVEAQLGLFVCMLPVTTLGLKVVKLRNRP